MKNDTDLPQSVTILEHVQKPTKQRFFVLGILFVSLSIIYLDRVNISIIAANTHFLNEMHLNDKPILVGLLMSLFLASKSENHLKDSRNTLRSSKMLLSST